MTEERLSDLEIISKLIQKLESIRVKGINGEGILESTIYFKCLFKYYDLNFKTEEIKVGKYIMGPKKNIFFKILDELIIYGYYLNLKDYTFSFIDKLEILPDNYKNFYNYNQMLSNKKFYISQLKVKNVYNIMPDCDKNFVPMNASILKKKDGYFLLCRTVNYRLYEEGKYEIVDPEKKQKSNSIMIKLDKNFQILFQHKIIDKSVYTKYEKVNIYGLEDGILFKINGELYASFVALDTNPNGRPEINICKFDTSGDIITKKVLISPEDRAEKNWLPFVSNKLNFIYSFDPLTIINDVNLKDNIKINKLHTLNFSNFKGSAAPIPFKFNDTGGIEIDGYLIIIHQATHKINNTYTPLYGNRFILLDKNFVPIKMSKQFYFQKYGIEFCRSMCYSHTPNEIIITYSVNDSSCNCCAVEISTIKNMLQDLKKFELIDEVDGGNLDDSNVNIVKLEELSLLYKKVNIIRHSNKTKDSYDDVYIFMKCFFQLLDINFPHDILNSGTLSQRKYSNEILNLIFLMIDELIILGYYMGYNKECLILSDKLILSPICPINKNQAVSNQKFYIKKLGVIKSNKININIKLDNFLPMNPSILQLNGEDNEIGYLINCRMVNYELNPEGLYYIKHPNRTIITENILIKTDRDFNVLSEHKMIDKVDTPKLSNPNIEGYEDLILFRFKNDICFTCTILTTNSLGRPQISLCKLNASNEIIEKSSIESPENRQEKNWLPFVNSNDEINIIYGYNPFNIKSISFNSVDTVNKILKSYDLNLSRLKGSASPIPFTYKTEIGYLIIVHETFNLTNTLRCYLHRFIYLSKEMEIKKMSHPWFFERHGIEFCRSMCHSHTQNNLILTYSIHDKDASWCEISIDYVKSLLKDIKYFMF